MTIAEMRALLGLGSSYTDAQVVELYGASIDASSLTPSVSTPPITVADAQLHLKVDGEDQLLVRYIATAVEKVEGDTGLVLSRRQVVEYADTFGRWLMLRSWPIASVDSIAYRTRFGTEALVPVGYYAAVTGQPARIFAPAGQCWPIDAISGQSGIVIVMTAGYADPSDVPAVVIQALLVLVAEYYRNREAGMLSPDAERAVRGLLRRYIRKTL